MCELPLAPLRCVSTPTQLQQSGTFRSRSAMLRFSRIQHTDGNNILASGSFSELNAPCWHQHKHLNKETNPRKSNLPLIRGLAKLTFCLFVAAFIPHTSIIAIVLHRAALKVVPVCWRTRSMQQNRSGTILTCTCNLWNSRVRLNFSNFSDCSKIDTYVRAPDGLFAVVALVC